MKPNQSLGKCHDTKTCLTSTLGDAYLECMDQTDALTQLRALAAQIDRLIEDHQRLADENRNLRYQQDQMIAERSQLLAKNEQARSRVEAMIIRLKALEQYT